MLWFLSASPSSLSVLVIVGFSGCDDCGVCFFLAMPLRRGDGLILVPRSREESPCVYTYLSKGTERPRIRSTAAINSPIRVHDPTAPQRAFP